jgi:deoxyadenosine/deoxycytidine kinase
MSRGSLFKNVTLVSISGIIGAGKSMLIKTLSERPELILEHIESKDSINLCFVKEPSPKWRKHGWTQRFYANPKEKALAFQLLVFTTHVKAVEKAIRKKREEVGSPKGSQKDSPIICIVERSMWDQLLFWKIQGVDSMEDDAYMQVWSRWNEFLPPVSKIFFCKTSDLSKTMERVALRASMIEEEKEGVSLEYQTLLYEKHCEWYTDGKTNIVWTHGKYTSVEKGVNCVHLSTDMPYHEDEAALKELAYELAEELKEYV